MIRDTIKSITEINENANPNTKWEIIKGSVRNETIKYTTKLKKDNNKEENDLKINIDKLENKLSNETDNNETKNMLIQFKNQLRDLNEKRTNGILMRSKAEIVEGSERNSKYFSNLEKRNAEKKNISKLIHAKVFLLSCDIMHFILLSYGGMQISGNSGS